MRYLSVMGWVMSYSNLSNHERAKMYKEKSRLIGRDILEIELLDGDRVKLIDVKDKDSSGSIEIPSFITEYYSGDIIVEDTKGRIVNKKESCFSLCKFREIFIDNSSDVRLDASSLCAMMRSDKLKLRFSNPDKVINMNNLFYECSDLKELDVSGLDTRNVTDMSNMFYGCCKLKELDVSRFNTSSVEDMSGMFCCCKSLELLDLSNFDTHKVINMSRMFMICKMLKRLDISGFNTRYVNNMSKMFSVCANLKEIVLNGIDTSLVTDMSWMFYLCINIGSIDMSSFDTSNVINMRWMFGGCRLLEELDLSTKDLSKVEDMSNMFNSCIKLRKLKMPSLVDRSINKDGMFDGCKME